MPTPGPLSIVNVSGNLIDSIRVSDTVPGQATVVPVNAITNAENPLPLVTIPVTLATLSGIPLVADASWHVLTKGESFVAVSSLTSSDLIAFQIAPLASPVDNSLGRGFPPENSVVPVTTKRTVYVPFGSSVDIPAVLSPAFSVLQSSLYLGEADGSLGTLITTPTVSVIWVP